MVGNQEVPLRQSPRGRVRAAGGAASVVLLRFAWHAGGSALRLRQWGARRQRSAAGPLCALQDDKAGSTTLLVGFVRTKNRTGLD